MKCDEYNTENYLLTESGGINWFLRKFSFDHKTVLLTFIFLCLPRLYRSSLFNFPLWNYCKN
jgi:hypothetical protein